MKKQYGNRLAPVSILHSSFCLHTFPCGALVDERGNVIGIVSAKVLAHGHHASAALAASGALPENVNYAVKSSLLLSFLESVPDVDAKLKAPVTAERKFEEVVKSAEDAAVLVLVY
jgi:hypothetical protein